MFSYYGSKSKIVKKYPKPVYNRIVEPFAGSARYALEYFDHDIILVDKFEPIIRIWNYLKQASEKDILSLPSMKPGESTDDYNFDCIEAKWLMGFMVQQGVNAPRKTVSKVFGNGQMGRLIEADKKRIAENLYKIRHWNFVLGDYHCLNNLEATWFIDPPYMYGGEYYHSKVNNTHMDYVELSSWAKERNGQVIVCENDKASWMEFTYLSDLSGSKNRTKEVMWYRKD